MTEAIAHTSSQLLPYNGNTIDSHLKHNAKCQEPRYHVWPTVTTTMVEDIEQARQAPARRPHNGSSDGCELNVAIVLGFMHPCLLINSRWNISVLVLVAEAIPGTDILRSDVQVKHSL